MKRLITPKIRLYENAEFLLNLDFTIKLGEEKLLLEIKFLATLSDGTGGCDTGKLLNKK